MHVGTMADGGSSGPAAGSLFALNPDGSPSETCAEAGGARTSAQNGQHGLIRLRGEGGSPTGDFKIGCIMVAAPVFFGPDEWVAPPADWPAAGVQQGKTYPLDHGEGERVLRDCMERANSASRYWNVDRLLPSLSEDAARYGTPLLVQPRLGQGLFSLAVRDAYAGACAVTGEHSSPVLEAAHIVPYGRGGEHRVDNGVLLRSDLHRLFDRGYVTVTPDYVCRF